MDIKQLIIVAIVAGAVSGLACWIGCSARYGHDMRDASICRTIVET